MGGSRRRFLKRIGAGSAALTAGCFDSITGHGESTPEDSSTATYTSTATPTETPSPTDTSTPTPTPGPSDALLAAGDEFQRYQQKVLEIYNEKLKNDWRLDVEEDVLDTEEAKLLLTPAADGTYEATARSPIREESKYGDLSELDDERAWIALEMGIRRLMPPTAYHLTDHTDELAGLEYTIRDVDDHGAYLSVTDLPAVDDAFDDEGYEPVFEEPMEENRNAGDMADMVEDYFALELNRPE